MTADAIDELIDKKEEPQQVEVLTNRTIGGLQIIKPAMTDGFWNILIYGSTGVGKTVLAASAHELEEMSPVLVIDVEGGQRSLKAFAPNVDVVRITNFIQFNRLYDDLAKNRCKGYKTIILDTVDEVQKFGMYSVMAKVFAENPSRDPDLPGIGEWGKNTEQVRRLVRHFRDLPCNTIMTCHKSEDKTPEGVVRRIYPSLSNKLAEELPGFFDLVFYMYISEQRAGGKATQVRTIITQPTARVVAKDRSNNLPLMLEQPTMKKIMELTGAN